MNNLTKQQAKKVQSTEEFHQVLLTILKSGGIPEMEEDSRKKSSPEQMAYTRGVLIEEAAKNPHSAHFKLLFGSPYGEVLRKHVA